MIGLTAFFYFNLVLFAVIGGMRGWAKELLISFSVILALFIIAVIENYLPVIGPMVTRNPMIQFWMRITILTLLLIFGYQTPNIPALQGGKGRFRRGNIADALLGIFVGLLNGYLIVGSYWYFIDQANYPYTLISAPVPGTPAGDAALNMIKYLPPAWLVPPIIFVVLAVFGVIMLVIFL